MSRRRYCQAEPRHQPKGEAVISHPLGGVTLLPSPQIPRIEDQLGGQWAYFEMGSSLSHGDCTSTTTGLFGTNIRHVRGTMVWTTRRTNIGMSCATVGIFGG